MPIAFEIQQGLPCVFTNSPDLTYVKKFRILNRNPTEQKRQPKLNIFFMKTDIHLNAEPSLFDKILGTFCTSKTTA